MLLALPLYVCLFKINRFMYSPIVSRFGSVASHSHHLLSCTKHRIGVLRSSKEVILCNLSSKMYFSAKKLKLMKICLLHCKKMLISLERNIFHVVELCS